MFSFCSACCELRINNRISEELKLFLKFVDDIVRTVEGDLEEF